MKQLLALFSLLLFSTSIWAQSVACKETRTMMRQTKYGIFRLSDNQIIGEKIEDLEKCQQAAEISNFSKNNVVCGLTKSGRNYAYNLYRISDLKIIGNMSYQSFNECDAAVAYSKPNRVCVRHTETGRTGYVTMNIAENTKADNMLYEFLSMCYENISTIGGN